MEFVQLKVVPATGPDNVKAGTGVPAQTVIGGTGVTVGVGLIVIVKVETGPIHPLAVGVIEIVPEMAVVPELLAVKEGKLVLPLAANPIPVLLFVHVKDVPAVVEPNVFAATVVLAQAVTFGSAVTVGVGFTVIV